MSISSAKSVDHGASRPDNAAYAAYQDEPLLLPSEIPPECQALAYAWKKHPRQSTANHQGGPFGVVARSQDEELAKKVAQIARQQQRQSKTRKTSKRRSKKTGPSAEDYVPPKVIRMPPRPLPLPPCLQCVLAGATCSLTQTPYARAYANDRVDPDQRLTPAARTWQDPTTSYALLVQELVETCPTPDAFVSAVARHRQTLEQRFMKQAIVRGATDLPFLAAPPPQCTRCRDHLGDRACLQQTADITRDRVPRPADAGAREKWTEVAWFASSGPPPLSLLPQHGALLLDQVRYGHAKAANLCYWRYHIKRPRLRVLRLEAVFCRDPGVLTAAQVAAKAQELLGYIGIKKEKVAAREAAKAAAKAASKAAEKAAAQAAALKDGKKKEGDDEKNKVEEDKGKQKKTEVDKKKEGEEKKEKGDEKKKQEEEKKEDPAKPKEDLIRQRTRPATLVEVSRMKPRWSRFNVYAGRGVATASKVYAAAAAGARADGGGGGGGGCGDPKDTKDTAAADPRPAKIKMRGPREKLPDWDASAMMAQPLDERRHVRDLEGMEDMGLARLFDGPPYEAVSPVSEKKAGPDGMPHHPDVSDDRPTSRQLLAVHQRRRVMRRRSE